MFTFLVDEISAISNSDSRLTAETKESKLAACIDELAKLRFSAILTARFADSPSQPPERQEELRERLATLRRQYSDKIDEIAMSVSVQAAIDAKDQVERTVSVPRGARL